MSVFKLAKSDFLGLDRCKNVNIAKFDISRIIRYHLAFTLIPKITFE